MGGAIIFLALFPQNYIRWQQHGRLYKNDQKECQTLQSWLLVHLMFLIVTSISRTALVYKYLFYTLTSQNPYFKGDVIYECPILGVIHKLRHAN